MNELILELVRKNIPFRFRDGRVRVEQLLSGKYNPDLWSYIEMDGNYFIVTRRANYRVKLDTTSRAIAYATQQGDHFG